MSEQQRTHGRAPGAGAAIGLIAKREVKARFFTKSNLISLAVMLVAVVVGITLMDYFQGREDDSAAFSVAVDAQSSILEEPLGSAAASQGTTVDVTTMDRAAAEDALTEDLDAFLTGDPTRPEMLVEEEADPQLLSLVTGAVQSHALSVEIAELGADPAVVGQSLAQAVPEVTPLVGEDEIGGMFGPAYFVAILMISLLLFALIGGGSLIAMGVVEEKTSRVVEILLATVRPSYLLAGKILGIGIVGLLQVVLLGGAAVITMAVTGLLEGFEINLTSAIGMTVLWFLLGYAIFALLFGGFAALVSRQEEIGAVTTPLIFALFVPYYSSMFMIPNNPDSQLVAVLSQVPFFSPFMMPMRSVFNAVEPWEIALAVAIALVTIPLMVWIAGRVYKRGVLHTGGRMALKDALRG